MPSLFWLWSPNPILAMFNLSRVQLPAYAPACFAAVPIRAPSLVASICAPSLHLRAHGGMRGGRRVSEWAHALAHALLLAGVTGRFVGDQRNGMPAGVVRLPDGDRREVIDPIRYCPYSPPPPHPATATTPGLVREHAYRSASSRVAPSLPLFAPFLPPSLPIPCPGRLWVRCEGSIA